MKVEQSADPKKILVIGGGPAGMEFAIEATRRGHSVELWEKNAELGGQLHVVDKPEGKSEFSTLVPYYKTMLKKLGIPVQLGKEATVEAVQSAGFDKVVVATGSAPRKMTLGFDTGSVPVVPAEDILSRRVMPGKNVIVIGGGAVGCEVADYMARKGSLDAEQLMFLLANRAETPERLVQLTNRSSRNVTVVEMMKRVGAGFDPGCGWPVMADMARLGVKNYTLSTVKGLENGQAIIETTTDEGTKETRIPCDTIVYAIGYVSVNELYSKLAEVMDNVTILGDANKVGKILDSVHSAIELASGI